MNPDVAFEVQLALKKQVERAIRPVRASRKRKLQMREEFWAHLVAIFSEERQRKPEAEALAAALDRFGEPRALTTELDQLIGWQERTAYALEATGDTVDAWLGFRGDIPWWRAASRVGVLTTGLSLLVAAAMWVSIRCFNPERLADPGQDPILWQAAPVIGLGAWGYAMALLTISRAVKHGRWPVVLAQAFLWSLAFMVLAAGFWWSITFSIESVMASLTAIAAGAGLVLPPMFLLLAWIIRNAEARMEPYRHWQSLGLEEGN